MFFNKLQSRTFQSIPSQFLPLQEMPEVLTRRVQLGLAADHKEESKQGKGRGKGRGRGRGKKTKTDAVDHEEVPAAPAAESSSKRGPPATPERRRLDFDVAASPDHHASDLAEKGTPPVRQEKKRVKATAKGKAAAKSAKAEQPAKHEPDTGNEPSTKETKKRARKGKKAGTEPAPEPAPSGQPKPVGEAVPHADPAPPEDAVVRGKKGPSERAIKGALKHLAEAKEDPASWLHVIKLWDVMDNMVHTKENPNLPKMQYWSYSMYWQSGRVGLLQKRVGEGSVHVCSFGGATCTKISLPLKAAFMWVGALIGGVIVSPMISGRALLSDVRHFASNQCDLMPSWCSKIFNWLFAGERLLDVGLFMQIFVVKSWGVPWLRSSFWAGTSRQRSSRM